MGLSLRMQLNGARGALLLAFGMAFGGPAHALSRMGEVEISNHEGKPCFGLPASERRRLDTSVEVYGIEVYESDSRPLRDLWAFEHAYPASTPLPTGACIAYGQTPAAATVRQSPTPLQPGRLYSVSLHASRKGPTHGYTTRFCLKAEADGTLKALQVRYHRTQGWTAAACLP
ncbi:hypothetical protein ACODUL_05515 [Stenotrophomonas maltophilia]